MRIATALLVLTLAVAPGIGAPPDVATVAAKIKAALEPDKASVRRLVFRVSGPGGGASEMTVGQARKRLGGIPRVAMVVLAPEALRGTALLVQESADQNVQWLYVPAVGRVRKLVSPEGETTFLNSDFTFADLGFVDMGMRWTQIGEEKREGVGTYRLEGIPRDGWYYSRVVVWVAAETFLPVERDFFDVANALFKVQRWSNVTTVDGVPTPLKTSMRNVQADTTTEVTVDAIRWGGDVPDTLFDPNALATAAASPAWQGLAGPVSAAR
jgi:outer membrane lipoprotein-sorting protein